MRMLERAVFIGNSRGSLEVAATTVADYNVSIPLSLSVFVFEIALSAGLSKFEEADRVLRLLQFRFGSVDADVLRAELSVTCERTPLTPQIRAEALRIWERKHERCQDGGLYFGRLVSAIDAIDLALIFEDATLAGSQLDIIVEDIASFKYIAARLRLNTKRPRLASRQGQSRSTQGEATRLRDEARRRGLRAIEAEACLAIAETLCERKEIDEAEYYAREAARLANADGEPYCFRLLISQIKALFQKIEKPFPSLTACLAKRLATLLTMPPIPDPVPEIPGITNTTGWSDAQISARLEAVKLQLDWENTTGSARKWWEAFENENTHRRHLVLRLAEELLLRKAIITEFFLAYVYSNTDDLQGNLCYLDYTRLKKDEERRKRATAEGSTGPEPTPGVNAPFQTALAGITDTAGWEDPRIERKLQEVLKEIDWDNTTGSARKWWEAFANENQDRKALVLRLAEELKVRNATVAEFFLAYVYSNTETIQANLCYLDYTRLKKEEERRKKEDRERRD